MLPSLEFGCSMCDACPEDNDPHVHDVHDLHASQVATGIPILTAHLVVVAHDVGDAGAEP